MLGRRALHVRFKRSLGAKAMRTAQSLGTFESLKASSQQNITLKQHARKFRKHSKVSSPNYASTVESYTPETPNLKTSSPELQIQHLQPCSPLEQKLVKEDPGTLCHPEQQGCGW